MLMKIKEKADLNGKGLIVSSLNGKGYKSAPPRLLRTAIYEKKG